MTKTLRLLFTAALVAFAAGCGSNSSGGSGTDTAKVAPAASVFYAEVNIDPTGSQEAGMRSILGDLPGSGPPEQRIDDLLEKASKSEKSNVDYLEDVKPWLGDKAAVFVAPAAAGTKDLRWALVVASTDEGKVKDTIAKGKDSGDREASYNGTDYLIDKDGTAMAAIDGFFITGSEAGLKAAIDVKDHTSLSGSDRYKQATKDASDERVALVYEDVGGLFQAAAGATGSSLGPAAPLLGRLFGGAPIVATVKAEQQALVVDGSLFPSTAGLDLFGKSTPLLGDVPADSWLAMGQADFGAVVKKLFGLFAGFAGGEEQLKQQLLQASGLDLDRDVFSWIGDVAFFVNGDSAASIGGGALIQSKDPEASKRALTKLSALAARTGDATVSAARFGDAEGYKLAIAEAPRGVFMLQAGDKVAITYGEDAAKSALSGSGDGLTSAPAFTDAAGKLGDAYSPSLYVAVPPILSVAESFGAGNSSDYQKAKPYLTILDYVIAGTAKSGDEAASRTRIGFKPHE